MSMSGEFASPIWHIRHEMVLYSSILYSKILDSVFTDIGHRWSGGFWHNFLYIFWLRSRKFCINQCCFCTLRASDESLALDTWYFRFSFTSIVPGESRAFTLQQCTFQSLLVWKLLFTLMIVVIIRKLCKSWILQWQSLFYQW